MKSLKAAAVFAVIFWLLLQSGRAQSVLSWETERTLADACGGEKLRFRKIENQIYDLQPLVGWYDWRATQPSTQEGFNRVDGSTRPLPDWQIVTGTVLQITESDGMLITRYSAHDVNFEGASETVRLLNYPAQSRLVDGKTVVCFAQKKGRFAYSSTLGARTTIASYDCGTKPTQADIEKMQEEMHQKIVALQTRQASDRAHLAYEKEKRDSDAKIKTFQFRLEQAKAGDAFAQYRLGQLYLAGEGVEKNIPEGKKWLAAAAAQGRADAAKLLSESP